MMCSFGLLFCEHTREFYYTAVRDIDTRICIKKPLTSSPKYVWTSIELESVSIKTPLGGLIAVLPAPAITRVTMPTGAVTQATESFFPKEQSTMSQRPFQ